MGRCFHEESAAAQEQQERFCPRELDLDPDKMWEFWAAEGGELCGHHLAAPKFFFWELLAASGFNQGLGLHNWGMFSCFDVY